MTDLYSDLFKEAYGFRPRTQTTLAFEKKSPADQHSIMLDLEDEAASAADRVHEIHKISKDKFDAEIARNIDLGAQTTVDAIVWIFQANGIRTHELDYGLSYILYHFGLDYSERTNYPFEEVILAFGN